MPREPISDQAYQDWEEIVYLLYWKMGLPRKTILEWFQPALSVWVLTSVASRIAKERPDDEYILKRKAKVGKLSQHLS